MGFVRLPYGLQYSQSRKAIRRGGLGLLIMQVSSTRELCDLVGLAHHSKAQHWLDVSVKCTAWMYMDGDRIYYGIIKDGQKQVRITRQKYSSHAKD
jgi:hypothetical protein